ncbi:MAG: hypothetical protein LC746_11140 [Acidobacteria bacterium]|nr:hypothetical protein [Acidobacteriota bacterium]
MPNLSRRYFLRGSALLLGGVVLRRAAPSSLVRLAAARVADAPGRPLRVLALGDSVMWGQGLRDEHKFTHKLRDWLCEQRGGGGCRNEEDVQLHVEAHSGAVVARPDDDAGRAAEERFTRDIAPVRYYGEVNHAYPTLWGQLELARRHYAGASIPPGEIDLVLVNGGINDLNATKILLYKILGGDLTEKAKEFCGEMMAEFLDTLSGAFPNARIVVPGYFPLVSTSTPRDVIVRAIRDLLPDAGEERRLAERLTSRMLREHEGDGSQRGEPKPSRILRKLSERSKEWVKASNDALEGAVKALNDKHPPLTAARCGEAAPPPEAPARALFVPVPFGDDNAYAAPRSFLWKLGHKPPDTVIECVDKNVLENLVTEDEMQDKRPCMCDHADKRNDVSCVRAGTFHPNREGADAYFRAIKQRLENVACFAGWTPAG